MSDLLAVDLGKTGCRVALTRNGAVLARGEAPGVVGLAEADGVSQVCGAIAAAASTLPAETGAATVGTLAVGLVGYHAAAARLPALADRLADEWGGAGVVLAGDVTTTHVGALGGGPGTVLAAGTGAVALAVGREAGSGSALADGWGYLLGDDGSGYAVGRAGLRAALLHHEGRGGCGDLAQRAQERFGVEAAELPAVVHSAPHPARLVAGFARDVAASARAGQQVARGIWAAAGADLARTTLAARAAVDPDLPVCLAGGLADVGQLLHEPFRAAVADLASARGQPVPEVVAARGNALDGAVLIGHQVAASQVPGRWATRLTMREPAR